MTNALDTRKSIVQGSLADVASRQNQSLAQTFVNAECVVIVDTSGSMSTLDSRNGKSRYDVACEELAALQGSKPGRIAVLSFSNHTMFCPDGKPYNQQSGTDLTGALEFAKVADVAGIQFIVISDGEPDNKQTALKVAKKYKSKIDVIFVGPEHSPAGRIFLQELAAASGGELVTADRGKALAESAKRLLEAH